MSRYDSGNAAEFFKLEILPIQTADNAAKCVKTLETNLFEFDTRHDLHFANTSRFFMKDIICVVMYAALELSLVAE